MTFWMAATLRVLLHVNSFFYFYVFTCFTLALGFNVRSSFAKRAAVRYNCLSCSQVQFIESCAKLVVFIREYCSESPGGLEAEQRQSNEQSRRCPPTSPHYFVIHLFHIKVLCLISVAHGSAYVAALNHGMHAAELAQLPARRITPLGSAGRSRRPGLLF